MANTLLKGAQSQPIDIPAEDLVEHFSELLSSGASTEPLPEPPPHLSSDPSLRSFSLPFTEEEVSLCVSRLKDSSAGEDRVTTLDIKRLSTRQLTAHLNRVLHSKSVPTSWRRSLLVAIPKAGLRANHPNNVRGIAVQSSMRKLFTLLVTRRLQLLVEERGLLPPFQNGFRPGHRTADNVFILRTLHEQACASQTPLYIAQIDIRKAFDSVSRPELFRRLYSLGIGGPLIDVLRASYTGQEVFLKANKRFSAAIDVNSGVLQGDPLSPLLFTLYMSHISLSQPDDPLLSGHSIPYLALADDFTVVATSSASLQAKIEALAEQCARVSLYLNPLKCSVMPMGVVTQVSYMRRIHLDNVPIPRVDSITINGCILTSHALSSGWDSDSTVLQQHHRALSSFRSIIALHSSLGITTPLHLRKLFRTLVESQSTYAIESNFDISRDLATVLALSHRHQLRVLAGVHPRSMTDILYRDFCLLTPLHRSLLLTVKFLVYAHRCSSLDRPLKWALSAQRDIPNGWLHRLTLACADLECDLSGWDGSSDIIKELETSCWARQHQQLSDLLDRPRLMVWQYALPLLSRPAQAPAPYLAFPRALARAVARLRTSTHNLAIERYRIGNRRRECNERVCPRCLVLEDEYHAISVCPEFSDLRAHLPLPRLMRDCLAASSLPIAIFLAQVFKRVDARYLL